MKIEQTIADIDRRMDDLESLHKDLLARSRAIIRGTKRMIHSIHHGENVDDAVAELQKDVDTMLSLIGDDKELAYLAEDAMMEFAEASILNAIVSATDIPTFEDLRITPRSWVLGLADSIGEIRRLVLDSLLSDDIQRAKTLFSDMQTIYDNIMMFDTPDPILPIRRKQDIARSLMERTRTDLANAVMRE